MKNDVTVPCPFCGGNAYEWGKVRESTMPGLRYTNRKGFVAEMFSAQEPIRARRCKTCDNVQLFIEPQDE